VVVFLLLGVIWAAVLIPPWLQSRREARPIASIMSFRSQLWSLQRATPSYGADVYDVYGDDDPDDEYDSEDAQVHALQAALPTPAAPGVIGAVVRPPSDGLGGRSASALTAAVLHRRAVTYRRRRQVVSVLLLAALAGIAPAVLLAGPWIAVEAVTATLLVSYLGLLIQRGRREAERAQKVRYLTPIRAPRPAVVIIGSGAAR
jgi:hypothetical protein